MKTAIVTSKDQITIPAAVRASMKLQAGSRVEFIEIEGDQFLISPAINSIQLLKGVLKAPKNPVSIEQMNQVIIKGIRFL